MKRTSRMRDLLPDPAAIGTVSALDLGSIAYAVTVEFEGMALSPLPEGEFEVLPRDAELGEPRPSSGLDPG